MPNPDPPARLVVLVSGSRHQPAGPARRRRRPGVRRRASWPSAPTATASRASPGPSAPGSRRSCSKVGDFASRGRLGPRLADTVAAYEPDLVVSAGFMKLVGPAFLERFGGRVRQHPPGAAAVASPGTHGGRPTRSRTASRSPAPPCSWSTRGSTPGPIIAQAVVPVADDDDGRVAARADQGRRAADARRLRGPDRPRGLHHQRQEGADRMTPPISDGAAISQDRIAHQAGAGLRLRQDRPGGARPRAARRRRRAGLHRRLRRADRGPRPPGHPGRGAHRLPRVPRRPGQDPAPEGARRHPRRPPPRRPTCSSSTSSASSRSTWSSPTSTRSPRRSPRGPRPTSASSRSTSAARRWCAPPPRTTRRSRS